MSSILASPIQAAPSTATAACAQGLSCTDQGPAPSATRTDLSTTNPAPQTLPMSSSPAGPEPQPTPAASPVILSTAPIITTTTTTTITTTTTTPEPSSAMSSPYQTPTDPPAVTTTDPVVTTVYPVTTVPSPPTTATKEPTGPAPTTAVIPPTTQRPEPTKDPIVTTVYTTRYITTMSVVTITTRVPHTTIIAGSVTTVYSIETTTSLVPTIIPDPSQPPPPPAMFDIVPVGSNRGLRGWQISLIIVAGSIFIGACASMFLVSWIRKKRLGTCAKDCGSSGSLMPVHLEPWNDPATAAAVMGPAGKGGNGGGGGWRDYEKEDGLADVDGGHLGVAGAGGAGALVLTGYSGEQDQIQQQQQQQRFADDPRYLAHGQDLGRGGDRGADFYYDLQEAVAAAGATPYPPPPNTLHQLHPPQHPQYVYGHNPQESPTDPLHPSLFRDEDNTELLHDSSAQPQQETHSGYYQQHQQQEPVSRPIALYSSPLMHLQTMGSPACSNGYTNTSQSPLTSAPLDGRNDADYADGYGYGFYASGMSPLQSREQPLGVDVYEPMGTAGAQNGKAEHTLMERHSKMELRRKSPQALLMVLDRNNTGDDDDSNTETEAAPSGESEEGQQSSGDVPIEGGVVEEVGGVGEGGGVGGGVGNGENIVNGDVPQEEERSSSSSSSALEVAIKEGHGRDVSSASVATSGEGGSSVSGGSGVKTRRYLDQLRVDTAP